MKEIDLDIFKLEANDIAPEQGKVLLSLPFLNDAYFNKTAILLTEHSIEGSMGFVLNKPHALRLHELVDGVTNENYIVCLGGPVARDTLFYIHSLGDFVPNSVEIMDGLYWGGEFASIKNLINDSNVPLHSFRFFLGYSGWTPGQLVGEIKSNTWLVSKLSATEIMHNTSGSLWNYALEKMGDKYAVWSTFPDDPSYN